PAPRRALPDSIPPRDERARRHIRASVIVFSIPPFYGALRLARHLLGLGAYGVRLKSQRPLGYGRPMLGEAAALGSAVEKHPPTSAYSGAATASGGQQGSRLCPFRYPAGDGEFQKAGSQI